MQLASEHFATLTGGRYQPRGTREQLYADDVLVNFDPGRARSAIRLLAQLSAQQQVIAFTCHPWLREAFEAEGARVQELTVEGSSALAQHDARFGKAASL